ncbi:PITH domain-containing protein GA19395-like [Ctenocephalides felis]|uniref:PITH domain-containing protein GA19395-like n=1 Tax=Ctenocephalides felis TaxID=7515 RepID=UPI000E6E34ED|nr:PITH domain-containing protein GA19395-like [Ctenocephalides felis]XP_026478889.1 PITH domain-containing protein GA19395-like [Ctenocephalides felis]
MVNHGHSCEGDHKHDNTPEMGLQYSLYEKIDTENLECLNETNEGSGKTIFKPWEERLNFENYVESDADEELLFNIPFTGNIKLKGLIIIGGAEESHPAKLRLYKNRPHMTFDDTAVAPDQEFELHRDETGTLEYPTKVVTFSSVHHLTIHIPGNFGSDSTRVYYIGLRGEYTKGHKHGVTICTYESAPNVSDHKADIVESVSKHVQ